MEASLQIGTYIGRKVVTTALTPEAPSPIMEAAVAAAATIAVERTSGTCQ